jgi:hypothetical protein
MLNDGEVAAEQTKDGKTSYKRVLRLTRIVSTEEIERKWNLTMTKLSDLK